MEDAGRRPAALMRFIHAPLGWTVEDHDDYVSMFPPTRDAELRVTIIDLEKPRFTPANWLKGVVYANRKLERQIVGTVAATLQKINPGDVEAIKGSRA